MRSVLSINHDTPQLGICTHTANRTATLFLVNTEDVVKELSDAVVQAKYTCNTKTDNKMVINITSARGMDDE